MVKARIDRLEVVVLLNEVFICSQQTLDLLCVVRLPLIFNVHADAAAKPFFQHSPQPDQLLLEYLILHSDLLDRRRFEQPLLRLEVMSQRISPLLRHFQLVKETLELSAPLSLDQPALQHLHVRGEP